MAWRDRLLERAEQITGMTVQPTSAIARLSEAAEQLSQFRNEAAELAYWTLDYFGGRPQEMQTEKRVRLAQRSRIAFIHDPLAGAEAELRANFAFGQGIGKPDAEDERVQAVIDRAWNDPANIEAFTGYAAQRRSSNSLLTQGNLLDTLYVKGGRIAVGKLDPDQVMDIVPDPENRLRPIYYIGLRRVFRWNVELNRPAFDLGERDGEGQPKVTYYPHWRNLALAQKEREDGEGLEPLPVIPDEKTDPGGALVYHTAINQLDEQLWGNPPWARTIRFYSAMNEFTEARVGMAKAASTFIARRQMTGSSQSEIVKSAGSLLAQTGELGSRASAFEEIPSQAPGAGLGGSYWPSSVGAPPSMPVNPGAWWQENEHSKLESLALNSGAAGAAQDAQIIRAPLAAAAQFGQHYMGDASNANLATATSLELPTLMAVLAWQKVFEDRYRWFCDRAIEAAVHGGDLGGYHADDGGELTDMRPLNELRIEEADDRQQMEVRTGKSLKYTFSMPYPGRRNLPDVSASLMSILGLGDGILIENEAMMEQSLLFLFTHGWQLDDPPSAVESVMKELKTQNEERKAMAEKIAAAGDPMGPGGPGGPQPPGAPKPGAPRRTDPTAPPGATPPKQNMAEQAWLPAELVAPVGEYADQTAELFSASVGAAALAAAGALGPVPGRSGDPVAA